MKEKAAILIVLFGFCIKNLPAQVCLNPTTTIYALNQSVGYIYPVNVNTAIVGTSLVDTTTAIGYPGYTTNANAIGLDIQNSTFYFFQNNTQGFQKFVSYNTLTKRYTVLATPTISNFVVKGCVTADGTGYYCIDGGNNLLYYNILANTWTIIGSNLKDQSGNSLASTFNTLSSGDMAIDGIGRLWIVVSSASNYGLYLLSAPLPNTPTSPIKLTQLVAPTTSTPTGAVFAGIAFSSSGTIYMSTTNDLYVLQNNLSLSHIAAFSIPGVGGDLTSCNFPFGVLQVSWSGFSATLQNNHSVLLTWSISQQVDITGYNVERSSDGQTWEQVGYQANEQGGSTMNYSYLDWNPDPGINYYRISAIDLNGSSSNSVIETVNVEGNNSVIVWPTPAYTTIKIRVTGNSNSARSNYRIFHPSGQLLTSGSLSTGVNSIDISSFSEGTYILQVTFPNGGTSIQKLVKF